MLLRAEHWHMHRHSFQPSYPTSCKISLAALLLAHLLQTKFVCATHANKHDHTEECCKLLMLNTLKAVDYMAGKGVFDNATGVNKSAEV